MQTEPASARESLPGQATSFWIATSPETMHPSLPGDLSADVAVLGGGIAGLTAALLLKRSGAKVVVLEANRIGSGVTGHTTGKLTSAHGLIYRDLIERFGAERARQYAQANREAVEFVASLVRDEGIQCDFHRDFACTYTTDDGQMKAVEAEVQAAGQLGLPVGYVESLDLPFPIRAAIRYENQAYFHSRKYLAALAERIVGDGSHVFENTRARNVHEGRPCEVVTDRGTVKAERVIVATHFPILNRGLFFAKMRVTRSYLLAATVLGELPAGMYINADEPTRTMRKHTLDSGEVFLIVGGENHEVGHVTDTIERYRHAESFAREQFRVQSIRYRWSTQDNRPADRVPFIGHHSLLSNRLFVATGFQGWGLSNGTVAGRILADRIAGRSNPWQEVFDANRIMPLVSGRAVSMNLHVARTFVEDRLPGGKRKAAADLAPGQAALADKNGREVAAFRDEQGQLHAVSPVCVHMGCKVRWNNAERSWDCPCHGSRYQHDGTVIHAPATRGLEKIP